METKNTPRVVRALRAAHNRKRGLTELEGAEAGFTLIELMVVLLIMAILLAIAIPTFLGVKSGAYDRSTQSNLTNALTSAKAGYANNGSYATTAASEDTVLTSAEPNLNFLSVAPATAGGNSVDVAVSSDGQELILIGWSQSGTCWAAEDNEGAITTALITGGDASQGDFYEHWSYGTSTTCAVGSLTTAGWGTHY